MPASHHRSFHALLPTLAALAVLLVLATGCGRSEPGPKAAAANVPAATSADCRACHESVFQAWSESHHAHAHRAVGAADQEAFAAAPATLGGVGYTFGFADSRATLTEQREGRPAATHGAEFVLGYSPLRQYVVPVGGGRYQMTELAWDPARREWFNVFGDERRQPGEWGHWLGRGMNWNSMCAHCHLTDFQKGYSAASDTYQSTWREHGVGCAQCHGDMPAGHGCPGAAAPPSSPEAVLAARAKAQETCAPCHARNELLTGSVRPGVPYHDHYRLVLPSEPNVFHPDGQMRDEVFNTTSFLLSRMGGKAGVTCLDCHEPHSGRTRLPVQDNALCLQCHGTTATRPGAIPIDPTTHSHHAPDSTGNRCVSCHMPTTTYMQRDPRHDHGFLKPDPLLTKELGIPNACNRCHTDRDVDWAIAATERWYGDRMESRQRQRARVVAAAQAGSADAGERLRAFLADEDIPIWRATLLTLARPYAAGNPALVAAARASLTDPDPNVRSAAVQLLTDVPGQRESLRPQLQDASRLVRLDAAWALSEQLAPASPERRELDAYLATSADQPAGQLRIAEDLFNRGRLVEAEAALRKAAEWDPNSAAIFATLGTVLNSMGRDTEAAAAFWRAAQKNPADAVAAFNAALAFAAAGQLADAELTLREAVRRAPDYHRAWYNLALLLAQTGRAPEAMEAVQTAERLAPEEPDYPYARATLLVRRGDRTGALEAARRALSLDPSHPGATEFLRTLAAP